MAEVQKVDVAVKGHGHCLITNSPSDLFHQLFLRTDTRPSISTSEGHIAPEALSKVAVCLIVTPVSTRFRNCCVWEECLYLRKRRRLEIASRGGD
jgi:hypothetical protein